MQVRVFEVSCVKYCVIKCYNNIIIIYPIVLLDSHWRIRHRVVNTCGQLKKLNINSL